MSNFVELCNTSNSRRWEKERDLPEKKGAGKRTRAAIA